MLCVLNLAHNRFGNAGIQKVLNDLTHGNNTLKTLNICDTDITSICGESIANLLEHSTSIVDLDISSNNLDHDALRCILQALAKNKTLVRLNISNIDIPADTFAKALKENSSIQILQCYGCFSGSDDAEHLTDILRHNRSITNLDIVRTQCVYLSHMPERMCF